MEDFVTMVMENSGIYKKRCVQMVCNGDGSGPACARALSQSRAGEDHKRRIKALGHQCEMSSRSGGPRDCCRRPRLSLNVSLTNRAVGLHSTADNTATLSTFIL